MYIYIYIYICKAHLRRPTGLERAHENPETYPPNPDLRTPPEVAGVSWRGLWKSGLAQVYIYICIGRERERESEYLYIYIYVYIYIYIYIHILLLYYTILCSTIPYYTILYYTISYSNIHMI